jgi:diacylglycerol kinase (ATP)
LPSRAATALWQRPRGICRTETFRSRGTANNVAHSLDLLDQAEEIAANLQGAPTRPFDLGSVKGPWGECSFIEAVGLGAFAPAITRSDPKPPFENRIRLGREALCDAIAAAEPHRIALTVDGEPLDGEFLFVEVLNLRFSGPGLPIAYFAEPGDQMLDIVLLCEDQRQTMLDWVRAAREESPRRCWCILAAT